MSKFKIQEFLVTQTGLKNIPNEEELANINILMNFLNCKLGDFPMPITVTSGFRSEAVNTKVGGVATSHHRLGLASDLTCKDVNKLFEVLKNHIGNIDQLIYYNKKNFVHVSVHPQLRGQILFK